MLDPEELAFFEEQFELEIAELPPLVRKLMDEVPMVVDDYPSPGLCRKLGLEHRGDLCGLYDGVSLEDQSIQISGRLSPTVYLFRDGILNQAADDHGDVTEKRLREEIRITILHEYGHHHGMDEDELEELGY